MHLCDWYRFGSCVNENRRSLQLLLGIAYPTWACRNTGPASTCQQIYLRLSLNTKLGPPGYTKQTMFRFCFTALPPYLKQTSDLPAKGRSSPQKSDTPSWRQTQRALRPFRTWRDRKARPKGATERPRPCLREAAAEA